MSIAIQRQILKLVTGSVAAASSPFVAGPLLYILTRGPESDIRNRLVDQINALPYKIDVATIVTALKYLVALNVAGTVNSYLNTISQNGWRLFADTGAWQWNKEVVAITGGSAGIGEQTVLRLIRKGLKVVVLDISPLGPALRDYANVHYIKTDVTNPDEINAAAAEIKGKFGPVTILINNAGIGKGELIVNKSPAFLNKIFGVNVLSHFYTAKAFLPDMVAKNHGHIVTIASTASFMSLPGIADYATTKAGVLSYHEALKQEIAHSYKAPGVLTTVVHPNWTRTALIAAEADKIEKQQGPLLTTAEVADNIVNQIFSCRGGQVIIPKALVPISTVKAWPNWMQEALRGTLGSQAAAQLI